MIGKKKASENRGPATYGLTLESQKGRRNSTMQKKCLRNYWLNNISMLYIQYYVLSIQYFGVQFIELYTKRGKMVNLTI